MHGGVRIRVVEDALDANKRRLRAGTVLGRRTVPDAADPRHLLRGENRWTAGTAPAGGADGPDGPDGERLLLDARETVRAIGLEAMIPVHVPPNDGGIAFGQAAVAAARLAAGDPLEGPSASGRPARSAEPAP